MPNRRKVHNNPVPLIGGVTIFLATTLTLSMAFPFKIEILNYKNIFIASSLLLSIGVIDDRFDLRASLKLAIQLILAHFIFVQGIKIESLQGLMGIYELNIWIQYILTIIVIAGVVNAFNLMDGIDGLAAGLALMGFIVFTIISVIIGQYMMALVFLTFIGSLLAFLRYNFSKNQKIFMGDGGSLMLGFVLVVSGIMLVQFAQNGEYNLYTTLAVISVLLVPVLDALRVFRRRVKAGKSPFNADRTHLHHFVLSIGIKHHIATLTIMGFILLLMIVCILSYGLLGLTTALVSVLLLFYFSTSILQFNSEMNIWKQRIKAMENNKS